jgi:hypothetical protein
MSEKKVLLVEVERGVKPISFIHFLKTAIVSTRSAHNYCMTHAIGRVVEYSDGVTNFQADSVVSVKTLEMVMDYMKSLKKDD